MRRTGQGAILFTGASASINGYPGSTPFAVGKFVRRGLAQSMARELAPKGIHVAHVVIDGAIRNPGRDESSDAPDSLLDPDAIARTYLHLLQQDRSARTCDSLETADYGLHACGTNPRDFPRVEFWARPRRNYLDSGHPVTYRLDSHLLDSLERF